MCVPECVDGTADSRLLCVCVSSIRIVRTIYSECVAIALPFIAILFFICVAAWLFCVQDFNTFFCITNTVLFDGCSVVVHSSILLV